MPPGPLDYFKALKLPGDAIAQRRLCRLRSWGHEIMTGRREPNGLSISKADAGALLATTEDVGQPAKTDEQLVDADHRQLTFSARPEILIRASSTIRARSLPTMAHFRCRMRNAYLEPSETLRANIRALGLDRKFAVAFCSTDRWALQRHSSSSAKVGGMDNTMRISVAATWTRDDAVPFSWPSGVPSPSAIWR
ncbi:hypothetical protein DSL92_01760 [Billgrantia gudaonensis]|uniref:Uncharacterized protein n=1 Tax=Billgrantia gudaonensis TaxID=376427 RepID=A0A3S0QS57_9GAMM|nr:hypothetical protein DSL92_01760 [Halomonas gudaonensis]